MVFTDPVFLFYFLPAVLALQGALGLLRRAPGYGSVRILFLFAATLVFYGWAEPWYLLPLFLCLVGDYLWARALDRCERPGRRRVLLGLAVLQSVGLFSLFKYLGFVRANLERYAPALLLYLPELTLDGAALLLPAGISFYTFESLSFLIDVYRRKATAPASPIRFLGFIGMFPRFIAGPIARYPDMAEQFDGHRGMDLEGGIPLFIRGLFRKVCFADSFAVLVRYGFEKNPSPDALSAWLATFCYTMQIYFDFSGYSLMAIGLGRCLGFRFPVNFDRPYLSTSISEYWRRWHISLGAWMRDYVYLPLGGNRGGTARTCVNLMIVAVVSGIWHGAGWTFLLWGIWHGVFLCLERVTGFPDRGAAALRRVLTFLVLLVGFVIFRSPSLEVLHRMLTAMFFLSPAETRFNPGWLQMHPVVTLLCVAGVIYVFGLEGRTDWRDRLGTVYPRWTQRAADVGMFVGSVAWAWSAPTIPFLYFRF